ncbi:MAG: hypothetical protein AB1805_16190 [Nitrospirota bacterium]
MKYIYYIAAAIVLVSGGVFSYLAANTSSQKKAVLIINDRRISEEELDALYASKLPYPREKSEFIDELITRELLIQEARKAGIDKEEPFRKSIKNFYEQSLTKVLLDRKFATMSITVSDDEVNSYRTFLSSRLHFTVLNAESREKALKGNYQGEERRIAYFDDLADAVKYPLFLLKEGEQSGPLRIGDRYYAVRLDRIEVMKQPTTDIADAGIRRILTEWKRERMINDWIEGLRDKASITIPVSGKETARG